MSLMSDKDAERSLTVAVNRLKSLSATPYPDLDTLETAIALSVGILQAMADVEISDTLTRLLNDAAIYLTEIKTLSLERLDKG
jgi:uncharacterized protein YjgD (DUF1641 family)